MEINGLLSDIIETMEQFAWISAALRPPTGDSLGLSQIDLRISTFPEEVGFVGADLVLLPLRQDETPDMPMLGSCWKNLFDQSVLAWGFPIAERGEEYGLELPFELMLRMSGARFPTEFQDTIIIRQGPITIFPIERHSTGIQWHVVIGDNNEFFKELQTFGNLPDSQELLGITTDRTYLGWLRHAKVKLATELGIINASGVPLESGRGLQLGDEISATFSLKLPSFGGFSVGASAGFKILIPKTQTQRIEERQLGYFESVQRSLRSTSLYYDNTARTGWLVPELSLVLHVARSHLSQIRPVLKGIEKIKYADSIADGAHAAISIIDKFGSVELWKRVEDENKPFKFHDLIEFYLHIFDCQKEAIKIRLDQNSLRADLGLRGLDLLDLVECKTHFRMRRLPPPKYSGGPKWWNLAKNSNTMVVFGTSIGQLIVPDRSFSGLCSSWAEIPPDSNLLVGTVRCFRNLCRDFENCLPRVQLSSRLVWHEPQDSRPFESCARDLWNPVQKLRDFGPCRVFKHPFQGLRNPTISEEDGAVIFGKPDDVTLFIRNKSPCHPLSVLPQPSRNFSLVAMLSECTNMLYMFRYHLIGPLIAFVIAFLLKIIIAT